MAPKVGTSSCLLFFFAINAVILDLLVRSDNFSLESAFFNPSTALMTLSLEEYFQGC